MDIDPHNPITIDFETYYGDDWAIKQKGMTVERYIRGEGFECICLSVKDGSNEPEFYPRESWVERIKQLVHDESHRPLVSHNTSFDMGVLGLRYNIHPKYMADTVAMATITGMSRAAGGASLDKLSTHARALGYPIGQKLGYVSNMYGVHADQMSDEDWEKYAEYCIADTLICEDLYKILLPHTPTDEIIMIGETTKMFSNPVFKLDTACLNDYAERLETARVENLQDIAIKFGLGTISDAEKALRSRTKFVPMLEACGVEVPKKISPTTGKETYALSKKDQAFLDLQRHHNPNVVQLVEAKLGAGNTQDIPRCKSFLDIASRGLMPIPLYYAAAHTLRYGGSDGINVQNLPKRKGDTSLRRAMAAPEGWAVVATDSSQVEARLLAYVANELELVDTFISKRCPYSAMAGKIYNLSYDVIYDEAKINKTKVGVTRRNVGKATVLGCGYGMGVDRFRSEMQLDGLDEAADMAELIIDTYRTANPNIKAFWGVCQTAIDVMLAGGSMSFGGPNNDLFFADGSNIFFGEVITSVRLPNGTHLFYQNLRKVPAEPNPYGFTWEYLCERPDKFGRVKTSRIYGGKLCENLIQALAFAVLKWQAIEITKQDVSIALNVHDEWVSVVPAADLTRTAIVHAKCMRQAPHYIPQGLLDCEVDVGVNYADTKTIDKL